jgi:predicted esterase
MAMLANSCRVARAVFLACSLLAGPLAAGSCLEPGISRERLTFDDRPRQYSLYVPTSVAATQGPLPLLVLLHGSGQAAENLLRFWTALADRERVLLVAPESADNDYWHMKVDGPTFIRGVVDTVASACPVDRRRTYLFGNSGGAVYGLTLALLESEYFAAAAVHAGAWRERAAFGAISYAKRKIPVSIFIGDLDEFFPLRSVRQTERALRDAGHPVSVTVLKGHTHWYRRVAPEVNDAAWKFLSAVSLASEPRASVRRGAQRDWGTTSKAMVVRGIGPWIGFVPCHMKDGNSTSSPGCGLMKHSGSAPGAG